MGDADPTRQLGRRFVGRSFELDALNQVIDSPGTAVVVIHGIAGVGKSALLRELSTRLARGDTSVTSVDCRVVAPTELGFLRAVGDFSDIHSFVRHLRSLPKYHLIAMDQVENYRLMDTWLRQTLVPLLPSNTTLVLAGRERPVAGWFSVPGFCTMPVGSLPAEDAHALLKGLGVRPRAVVRLARLTRGHPLALVLAAAGVSERPELSLEDAALTRVVDALTRVFLQDVQDPVVRDALEAGSVVRRITGPLLVAMLGEGVSADELLSRMLELPFVDVCLDGLVVHEAVRDAIAGLLRGTQPDRYRHYRRAAWRLLQGESRDAPAAELWRFTADMLYLIDNPVVREAFFPSGGQPLTAERATNFARETTTAIASRHEGPAAWTVGRLTMSRANSSFADSGCH
jgi:hypothetical protein